MDSFSVRYGSIDVLWNRQLGGGGQLFGQDFVRFVGNTFGTVDRVLEACAGPGFIGFSLLGNGLCNSVAFSDINPDAVALLESTIEQNSLRDRVDVYQSDAFKGVPSTEQVDLIVVHPPHFPDKIGPSGDLRRNDPDWQMHEQYFHEAARVLKPGGSILLLENWEGSTPEDFMKMIRSGGLEYVGTFPCRDTDYMPVYYLWALNPAQENVANTFGTVDVDVHLSSASTEIVEISTRGKNYQLRVRNDADHDLSLVVTHDSGYRVRFHTFHTFEIPSGGERVLPRLNLQQGWYFIENADREAGPLARVRVA